MKGEKIQSAYRFAQSLEERRQFIRQRQDEIMVEIDNGMPKWEKELVGLSWWIRPSTKLLIWTAITTGNIKAAKAHLIQIDINAKDLVSCRSYTTVDSRRSRKIQNG